MNATSHNKAFVPSVEGIKLQCNVKGDGPVSFVKRLQRSSTWYLISLDGFVKSLWLEGGNFDVSPQCMCVPRGGYSVWKRVPTAVRQ